MKQTWCACSCSLRRSSALGGVAPEKRTRGRSSTRVMAIRPSAFFSMWPTASSSYESTVSRLRAAIARNESMWQLDSAMTSASSGLGSDASPRYSGADERVELDAAAEAPVVVARIVLVRERLAPAPSEPPCGARTS